MIRRPGDSTIHLVGSPGEGSNPFTRLQNDALRATTEVQLAPYSKSTVASAWPDVWHLNWPEAAYRADRCLVAAMKATKLLLQLRLARLRGTRIAWTVHNLAPHEQLFPWVDRWFWPRFHRQVDLFVHLSAAGRQWFLDLNPSVRTRRHVALWHPAYPIPDDDLVPQRIARTQNGIESEVGVASIVGRIARYKGVPAAIRTFSELSASNVRLIVAGQSSDAELEGEIRALADQDTRVRFESRFLEPRELHLLIRASDIVVLPYDRFLNSGAQMLSLSLGRPVLVPATPVTAELQAQVGDEWVRTYEGLLTSERLEAELVTAGRRGGPPSLADLDWPAFADALLTQYRAL